MSGSCWSRARPLHGRSLTWSRGLVRLHGQQVVPARCRDVPGALTLAVHGVRGYHRADDVHRVDQIAQGRYLVAVRSDRKLAQYGTGGVIEGGDQMPRARPQGGPRASSCRRSR